MDPGRNFGPVRDQCLPSGLPLCYHMPSPVTPVHPLDADPLRRLASPDMSFPDTVPLHELQMVVTFALIIAALVFYAIDRIPMELTSLGVICAKVTTICSS